MDHMPEFNRDICDEVHPGNETGFDPEFDPGNETDYDLEFEPGDFEHDVTHFEVMSLN